MGSGGCKVAILDSEGNVVSSAYQEYQTNHPHPGWDEQDPRSWTKALASVIDSAAVKCGINKNNIMAMALSGATHGFILTDHKGIPLRPCIIWTDSRSTKQARRLNDQYGDDIFRITLHQPNVHWTLPQLMWVMDNEPHLFKKANKLMMVKDYMRYILTGTCGTDWMDAHGTLLFDVPRRQWSDEICKFAGIEKVILPEVSEPTKIVGMVTEEAASIFNLPAGIPVAMGTTDQAAEALASGALSPGQGIIKLATAGNVAIVSHEPHPRKPDIYAYYHIIPEYWYVLTGTVCCAECYRWLRDLLYEGELYKPEYEGFNVYEAMDHLASNQSVGSERLIFYPHLNGTLSDPSHRGVFCGIGKNHGKAHFIRAVLEGVAFSIYDCIQALENINVKINDLMIIGGGAKGNLWPQIICDVSGKKLQRPSFSDSSVGSAILAGVAVGIFSNIYEGARLINRNCRKEFIPNIKNNQFYMEIYQIYKKIETSLQESFTRLSQLN